MGLVTPDFGLVFWMVVSFGAVLFILKKFAWKPILQALKDRENSIENALNSAKRAKEEMALLKSENEKILQEAKQERDKLIKEARETKDKIVREAESEAKVRANKMIEDAKAEIENEKMKALDEVKSKVAELSIAIAGKILKSELSSDSKQKDYIQKMLDEVKTL